MKNLLILVSLIWTVNITAQSYHPLLETNKYWTVESADYISLPPVVFQTTYSYQGDTIINSINYKDYGVIIREDTAQKRVYLRDTGHLGGECLLYDFSAQVGDTLQTCNFTIVIDSISTILLLNNEIRKIFYYSGTSGRYYIEGIGSNVSFKNLSGPIGPPSFDLMYVKQNNIEIYGSRCNDVVGLKENVNYEDIVTIFPSPTSSQLTIDTKLNIKKIVIIDLTGKILKTITANFNIVNVADFPTGIYFIKLITNKRTITKKFVKQ